MRSTILGSGPEARLARAKSSWQRVSLLARRREMRHLGLYLRYLRLRNQRSRTPVVAPGGPMLSLTTYGARIHSVFATIESIGLGSVRPSRLILWLDDERLFQALPESLRRLIARGLEVRLSPNFGPHTKYFPTLGLMDTLAGPLVTADDDMLYTPSWLAGLAAAYQQAPDVLHCYRAHRVHLDGERMAPYATWTHCRSATASYLHFPTAVSGNILPPPLLAHLKSSGTAFQACCPKADDVWVHAETIRAGVPVRQINDWQHNYPVLPGTQAIALHHTNVDALGNDQQIQRTYTSDVVERLQAASLGEEQAAC